MVSDDSSSPLSNAQNIYKCVELFASKNKLHVVAIEGTIFNGKFYTFDINTNSNYNSKLEKKAGLKPAVWEVVESMYAYSI